MTTEYCAIADGLDAAAAALESHAADLRRQAATWRRRAGSERRILQFAQEAPRLAEQHGIERAAELLDTVPATIEMWVKHAARARKKEARRQLSQRALGLAAANWSNHDIGHHLGVSRRTVARLIADARKANAGGAASPWPSPPGRPWRSGSPSLAGRSTCVPSLTAPSRPLLSQEHPEQPADGEPDTGADLRPVADNPAVERLLRAHHDGG